MHTDVIVIGSGFGGSVVAARAAQADLRVTVLERGGLLDASQWDAITDGRLRLHRGRYDNGPLDIHVMRGLGALTGNAVGGGSRIYTAVTIRPRPDIFERDWPADVNGDTLAPCYDRVEAEIRPTPCDDALPRIRLMNRLGHALCLPVARLPLAMDWGNTGQADNASKENLCLARSNICSTNSITAELADWFRGIGAAKRGLNQTYLRLAEQTGAIIEPLSSVEVIEPIAGGFRVHFQVMNDGGAISGSMTARRVVLAAGTLNTVRLLFANRDDHRTLLNVSDCLGERFSTNGDRGGLLFGVDHDWAADHAPPATSWFDLWDAHRMFIMDLGKSPIVQGPWAGLLRCLSSRGDRSQTRRYEKRHSSASDGAWLLGIMGWDDAPRRLAYAGQGRLTCVSGSKRDQTHEDKAAYYVRSLAREAGAHWKMVPAFLERRMPMTVHPLGGAAMADSPAVGVTDSHGEVFGHPGLFVADGSLLPTSTGVPPSMTIAALAERVSARVVEAAR